MDEGIALATHALECQALAVIQDAMAEAAAAGQIQVAPAQLACYALVRAFHLARLRPDWADAFTSHFLDERMDPEALAGINDDLEGWLDEHPLPPPLLLHATPRVRWSRSCAGRLGDGRRAYQRFQRESGEDI